MNLSEHFTLDEFTHSQVAIRTGISNDPPIDLIPTLKRTAKGLEAIRTLLGDKPINISSGYRSPMVNNLVGSKPSSQHLTGQAVDFTCPSFGSPSAIVRRIVSSGIEYDQCILEFASPLGGGWVHISFSDKPRRQALIIDSTGARAYA